MQVPRLGGQHWSAWLRDTWPIYGEESGRAQGWTTPFLSRSKEPHLRVWPPSFLIETLRCHSLWDTEQR